MNSCITMATSVGPPEEFSVAIQSYDAIAPKKTQSKDKSIRIYFQEQQKYKTFIIRMY